MNTWVSNLEPKEQNIILKICENINYYSQHNVADIFKELEQAKLDNIDLDNVLFLPLKTKDRAESADGIFTAYIFGSELRKRNHNNILMLNSEVFIKNFVESYNFHQSLVNKYDSLKRKSITVPDEEYLKMDKIARKKIKDERMISNRGMAKINTELQDYWDKKEFSFDIKRIIFIDDFLCSGTSVCNFLDQILPILNDLDRSVSIVIDFWFLETYEPSLSLINNISKQFPNNIEINIEKSKNSIDFINDSHLISIDKVTIENVLNEITSRFKIPTVMPRLQQNLGIASFVNAPNNNLNIITKYSNNWPALFPRTTVQKVDNKQKIKKYLLEKREPYK